MTDLDLDAIQARAEKAHGVAFDNGHWRNDCCASAEDVPALLALVREQREELARHHADFVRWEQMAANGHERAERAEALVREQQEQITRLREAALGVEGWLDYLVRKVAVDWAPNEEAVVKRDRDRLAAALREGE